MKDKIKISIIIPCYNCEKYIKRCIQSIYNQNYNDYEIIFVDNNSTDDSLKIAKSIKSNRLKIYECKRKGVSNARNYGLKQAKYEYCMFIDSDDFLENNCLTTLNSIIKSNNNIDIIYFNYYSILNNKKIKSTDISKPEKITKDEIQTKFIPKLLKTEFWGSVWRMLIKKSVINMNHIYFDSEVSVAEDLLFNLNILKHVCNIQLVEKPLYNYYVNSSSTLNTYKKENLKNNIVLHSKISNLIKEHYNIDVIKKAYAYNKIVMYTSSISNAVRSGHRDIAITEIKILSDTLLKDNIDISNLNLKLLIRLTLYLLKKKQYFLLYVMYTIKEKIRIRKLARE